MIRKADKKDIDLIIGINKKSKDPVNKRLKITDGWLKKNVKEILKNNGAEVYLYGNKAYLIFKREFAGFNNCEIHGLIVDKHFQRQGIGVNLVKYAEKRAKKLGFKGIYLYTHEMRKGAHKFYKEMGYKKINKFPNYYSNGDTSILFGKHIK